MDTSHVYGVRDAMKDICGYNDLDDFHGAYGALVKKIGIERLKPYMPEKEDVLRKKFEKDEHLNNISIKEWDFNANLIAPLLWETAGINWSSLSQRVCILKEAAAIIVKEA